ncbi:MULTISPECIES: signal peptide peptidase SppA [unclassified Desulfovibrio]|uniref:signal peptide peptidase SppA n=1 Tax=unclassified Desulfovibrio TaxID=2593640 RepID=UPI0013ECD7A9|nr:MULTISPECIES: signal peptide peptidase SppA [unclassified Desulfovibrio]
MADTTSQDSVPAPGAPASGAPGGSPAFTLEAAAKRADSGCGACPLGRIPASVWRALLRPPFRKRHPVLFWGLVVLSLVAAGAVGRLAAPPAPGERLALVSVRGPILDPVPTLAWVRQLEQDERVKGVLLRVDSPGGGAAASQEIYAALERLSRKVPIVVSMGATAASGALMVSMAGARIYANPSTVTGSIGVRMDIPQLQGLMDKVGVGQETLVTAPYKDAASYLHPLTPKDRAYLEHVLMDMHEQFVAIVAKGRHMEREQAVKLADGKIFTGQEAKTLGLVDVMGGQDAALDWLAEKTGVPATRPLLRKQDKAPASLLKRLLGAAAEAMGLSGALELAGAAQLVERGLGPAFLYQM